MRLLGRRPEHVRQHDKSDRRGRARRGGAGIEIVAVNPSSGPGSIEGYFDEAFAVPGMIEEILKGEAAGAQAFIIACFDDTGLEAARCAVTAPSSASARPRFTWPR